MGRYASGVQSFEGWMDGNRDRTASTTILLLILVALERPPEAVEAKMEG